MRVHLENLLHTCYGLQRQVIQGYRMIQDDTGIQGYRDTGVQGYRGTGVQGFLGSYLKVCRVCYAHEACVDPLHPIL